MMPRACSSLTPSLTLIQTVSRHLQHRSYLRHPRNEDFLPKSIRWSHNKSKPNPSSSKTTNIKPVVTPKNELPKAFFIGSIAGTLGSLAGMGGGFVMIPLMTSRLGISQHVAHGTSLFAVAATGIAGSLAYSQDNSIDTIGAIAITSGAILSARLGANFTSKLSEHTLKRSLGVFMICVAPLVPAKTFIAQWKEDSQGGRNDEAQGPTAQNSGDNDDNNDDDKAEQFNIQKVLTCSTIGLASGFLAGLFGVGGGAVVVPALTVLTDMDHYTALGTSLCAMTLPAIVGTATHSQRGNVNLRIAPMLALGSFLGAYFGGKAGVGIEEEKLRWGFSGLMATLGLKTLFRA